MELRGRRGECDLLYRLIEAVRGGESRVLVVRGEAGVGKTALLEYVVEHASGCRVARAMGVQSDMQIAFAGLHQLLAPMLDRLEGLPAPQRRALRIVFGISPGPAPDRFLVALAVLSLLSDVAEERPLICVVDDEQWLDHASAQALAFVARRLDEESVGLLFAARTPSEDLAELPQLVLDGLRDPDARALLDSVLTGPIYAQIRDRIVSEARGNPLALLELPRGVAQVELAGGFGLVGAVAVSPEYRGDLPSPARSASRRDAAADDARGGGPARRAVAGVASGPAARDRVRCGDASGRCRPCSSSAHGCGSVTRWCARSPSDRRRVMTSQEMHGALAEATDAQVDPDRRAWHRAQAAAGPDEEVADELERSAGRALERGGLAAAAAFLERAAGLTVEPLRRRERALAAAQAKQQAGAPDAALRLLAAAEQGPLGEFQRAQVGLLRAQIAFAVNRGSDAPALLLKPPRSWSRST